ncbi:MAG TPA: CDP-alcohol phosphatidyltransferase family protein, partial [Candidatus Acidoferrum sp.]|nr:CDP-alcohol phosphatidyltransferase family protein [Candidatus Acidoferrum sp.]
AAATQNWVLAGILVIVFGIFDLFDGALARATGQVSKFGAFLDSTLDRTGENLVLAGVAYGCASAGFELGAGLAAVAIAFASVVTYTRAKAEVIGLHGEVGIAPRPERLVVLAVGLVLTGALGGIANPCFGQPGLLCLIDVPNGNYVLGLALGILVATCAITIVQRILHVKHQLESPTSSTSSTR